MYNLYKITVDYRCTWAHHLLQMKDTCRPKLKYEHILTNRRKHKFIMKKIKRPILMKETQA